MKFSRMSAPVFLLFLVSGIFCHSAAMGQGVPRPLKDLSDFRRDYFLEKPFQYSPMDPWQRGNVFQLHSGHAGFFYNCDGEECKRNSPYICWKIHNEPDFPQRRGLIQGLICDYEEIKRRVLDGACCSGCSNPNCAGNCQQPVVTGYGHHTDGAYAAHNGVVGEDFLNPAYSYDADGYSVLAPTETSMSNGQEPAPDRGSVLQQYDSTSLRGLDAPVEYVDPVAPATGGPSFPILEAPDATPNGSRIPGEIIEGPGARRSVNHQQGLFSRSQQRQPERGGSRNQNASTAPTSGLISSRFIEARNYGRSAELSAPARQPEDEDSDTSAAGTLQNRTGQRLSSRLFDRLYSPATPRNGASSNGIRR
ncbi:MAG: hypothetical protein AAF456_02815 [Planctomycetota bacterium]